jgi:hypothetical protein
MTISRTLGGAEPCLDEVEVYGPREPSRNLALASAGAKAAASSLLPGYAIHQIHHLVDGRHGNDWSWISNERGRGWVQVSLPESATIDRVVWSRDRQRRFQDRLAEEYKVEVSRDGKNWETVAGSWDRYPPGRQLSRPEDAATRTRRAELEKSLARLSTTRRVYAGTFTQPGPTHLLKRGDPLQKGAPVPPSAVRAVSPPLVLDARLPEVQRRLALARWLADPANPLPARVMVNRVWHHHFGQGIVRTPSDFGYNGDRPSHPELLDWLAAEYQANGWRLKPLQRLIVLSAGYRQSGRLNPAAGALDADNRLLWRRSLRRLDAEVIRDTLLQVSGNLERTMGGPGYQLWDTSNYVTVYAPRKNLGANEFRRMVYQFKPRLQQDPVFGAFDCPDATQTVSRRHVSTTPLQALNLLNDPLVHAQAAAFAQRVQREASGLEEQVRHAFRLAFGREPRESERTAALNLARARGLAVVCHALFNANEFVFVD